MPDWTTSPAQAVSSGPSTNWTNSPAQAVSSGPPVITTHPTTQTVTAGNNVTFTVVATGASSYQWQKNGANIGGATGASLTISNAQSGDAGTYRCVVSNGAGTVNSNNATLTVNPAPSTLVYFGNFTGSVPGSFSAGQIQALVNGVAGDSSSGGRSQVGRSGTYQFDSGATNTWKVFAWPTSYTSGGTIGFTVQGFPFNLQPSNYAAYQTGLMIGGTSYDVFVSANQDITFTTAAGNPVVVA